MARVRTVGLEGAEDLIKTFRDLDELADTDEAYDVMQDAARIVAAEIRAGAPGSLAKWVRAGRMRRKVKGRPAAWVTVAPPSAKATWSPGAAFSAHYRGGGFRDEWAFPYVVEYGTPAMRHAEFRRVMSAKGGGLRGYMHTLVYHIGGRTFFSQWVAKMPKRPFFRRGYDRSAVKASTIIFDGVTGLIDKAWAKRGVALKP